MKLDIDYDARLDILTIDGGNYSGEFFRAFSAAPLGTLLRIEKREDGTVTVRRYAPGETVTA